MTSYNHPTEAKFRVSAVIQALLQSQRGEEARSPFLGREDRPMPKESAKQELNSDNGRKKLEQEFDAFRAAIESHKRSDFNQAHYDLDVYIFRLHCLLGIHVTLLRTLEYLGTQHTKENLVNFEQRKMKKIKELEHERDVMDNLVYNCAKRFHCVAELGDDDEASRTLETSNEVKPKFLERLDNLTKLTDCKALLDKKHIDAATLKAAFCKMFMMYAQEDWHHYSIIMDNKLPTSSGEGPSHDEVVEWQNYYEECVYNIQRSG